MITRLFRPDELPQARALCDRAPAEHREPLQRVIAHLARAGTTLLVQERPQAIEVVALATTAEPRELEGVATEVDEWRGCVFARVGERSSGTCGFVAVPYPGERVSGDAIFLDAREHRLRFAVIDGLGHGRGAHEASAIAVEALGRTRDLDLPASVQAAHEALRNARGAAIGMGELDRERRSLAWIGVGNVAGVVPDRDGVPRGLASQNGTLGNLMPRLQVVEYPWRSGRAGVFHTDGLVGVDLGKHPGLEQRHPSLIASVLYHAHGKNRDDATVLVVRDG